MSYFQDKPNVNNADITGGKYLTPFQRKLLQKSLQQNLSALYHQRIQIMLLADSGKSQIEICQILRCCPATVSHWMHIARTGMAHKWQDCPLGRPKAVNDQYLVRLKELLSTNPREHGYIFRRWTVNWLSKHLAKELGIVVSDRHLKRLLKQMGLSTIPKPNHVQQTTTLQSQDSKILINDLKEVNTSAHHDFLAVHFTFIKTIADFHDTKST